MEFFTEFKKHIQASVSKKNWKIVSNKQCLFLGFLLKIYIIDAILEEITQ